MACTDVLALNGERPLSGAENSHSLRYAQYRAADGRMIPGRDFRALWAAYTISIVGDWAYRLAIPLVVYDLTQSPFLMSLSYAATFAPFIIVMPFGGVLADAVDRKRLLWIADFVSGCIALAICLYLSLPGANAYWLMPGLAVLGAISSISHPAFQGFLPSTVPPQHLSRANSLITTSDSVLNLVAPAIGGSLVALLGAYNVLWLNAASFFLSMALILIIRAQNPVGDGTLTLSVSSVLHGLGQGLKTTIHYPIVKWGTFLFILVNFSSHLILGNIIYFLTQDIGLSPELAGLALGLSAIGAIIGSLIAPKLMQRVHPGRLMLACVFVSAIGTATLLLAEHLGFWGVVGARSITMASEAVIVVTMFTERQRVVPTQYLSRVVAITRTISYVPVPLAAMLGGYILAMQSGNMSIVILLSVIVLVTCVVIGIFTPFVKTRTDAILEQNVVV